MKAFLIVDMSNDFVDDKGSLTAGKPAQEIVPEIVKTAQKYLNNGDIIAICMDDHSENDKHFELWPKHCVKGTWGSELYGDLKIWYKDNKDNKNILYISKSEYDAFYKTNLGNLLKEKGVNEVLIGGVCTDICVFNTVYGAYKEGFVTKTSPKLCATFTENGPLFIKHMNSIYKTEII